MELWSTQKLMDLFCMTFSKVTFQSRCTQENPVVFNFERYRWSRTSVTHIIPRTSKSTHSLRRHQKQTPDSQIQVLLRFRAKAVRKGPRYAPHWQPWLEHQTDRLDEMKWCMMIHNCPSQSQGRNNQLGDNLHTAELERMQGPVCFNFSILNLTTKHDTYRIIMWIWLNFIKRIGVETQFSLATILVLTPPEVHGLCSHLPNTTKDHIFNLARKFCWSTYLALEVIPRSVSGIQKSTGSAKVLFQSPGTGENTLFQLRTCSMIVYLQVSASKTISTNSHTTAPKAIPLSRGVVAAQAGHRTQRHPAPLDGSLQGVLKCEDATKSEAQKRHQLQIPGFYSGWFGQMLHNAYLPVQPKANIENLWTESNQHLPPRCLKTCHFSCHLRSWSHRNQLKTHQD